MLENILLAITMPLGNAREYFVGYYLAISESRSVLLAIVLPLMNAGEYFVSFIMPLVNADEYFVLYFPVSKECWIIFCWLLSCHYCQLENI